MGVLDVIGELLEIIFNSTVKKAEEMHDQYDRASNKAADMSNDRLIRNYKSASSVMEKKAYYDELMDRKDKKE